MADVHDRIIELQKNQLQIVQKLEETRESLDAKKRDMEQLEREVNRLTDHKRIQEEVGLIGSFVFKSLTFDANFALLYFVDRCHGKKNVVVAN